MTSDPRQIAQPMPHSAPPRSPWPIFTALLGLAGLLGWFAYLGWQAFNSGGNPAANALPSQALKITVSQPGMYRVSAHELGLPNPSSFDPSTLRLANLGVPQTFWYSKTGDAFDIYFWGQPLDDPYTRENVYILTTASTPFVSESPGVAVPPLPAFPLPLHLEENRVYFPKAEPYRTWYWKSLTAPAAQTFAFNVAHLDAAGGGGVMRLALFSTTSAAGIDPDHRLTVLLNDAVILEEAWDGAGYRILETPLNPSLLNEGTNALTLQMPGDTGAAVETILLDWIQVAYPKHWAAEDERVAFIGQGGQAELAGFSGPIWLFELFLPEGFPPPGGPAPIPIIPQANPLVQTREGAAYFAAGEGGFLSPDALAPAQSLPDLRAPGLQADYLAVGPDDLLAPLAPLIALRQEQGLRPLAVPVQAIYDQFGHGIAHPAAIRNFVQHAYESWQTPPQYLLLVGDSTYDPRGEVAPPKANRLPAFFVFTFYGGETVSDVAYAQLDGDALPDIAVGRIPARTAAQVRIIVEKILQYERDAPSGAWQDRVLAIADPQDASFQQDAARFLDGFSGEFEPLLLTAPQDGSSFAREIAAQLEAGALFLSYFGHGSITNLGKDQIFSNADVSRLSNAERLPVMINMTCLAGLFTHPEVESLTEAMLWHPGGGAVAALSATSLTTPLQQSYLSEALTQALSGQPGQTLGSLLLAAQRQMPADDPSVREVLDTFLLFGDPALRLPQP